MGLIMDFDTTVPPKSASNSESKTFFPKSSAAESKHGAIGYIYIRYNVL